MTLILLHKIHKNEQISVRKRVLTSVGVAQTPLGCHNRMTPKNYETSIKLLYFIILHERRRWRYTRAWKEGLKFDILIPNLCIIFFLSSLTEELQNIDWEFQGQIFPFKFSKKKKDLATMMSYWYLIIQIRAK